MLKKLFSIRKVVSPDANTFAQRGFIGLDYSLVI